MNKEKIKHIVFSVLAVLMIVIGVVLMFHKNIRNQAIAKKANENIVANVDKEILDQNKDADANFDFDQVRPVSSEEVLQAHANPAGAQSFLTVAGIAIPELGMNLPIYKGVDSTSLMYGAGTMKEDQELGKGNYALASHHIFEAGQDHLLFSPLSRAQTGMMVYITDKENIYRYQISEIFNVTPDRGDVINDSDGVTELTLVTCTDMNATERIIVKATYVDVKSYDDSSNTVKSYFQTYQTTPWW